MESCSLSIVALMSNGIRVLGVQLLHNYFTVYLFQLNYVFIITLFSYLQLLVTAHGYLMQMNQNTPLTVEECENLQDPWNCPVMLFNGNRSLMLECLTTNKTVGCSHVTWMQYFFFLCLQSEESQTDNCLVDSTSIGSGDQMNMWPEERWCISAAVTILFLQKLCLFCLTSFC